MIGYFVSCPSVQILSLTLSLSFFPFFSLSFFLLFVCVLYVHLYFLSLSVLFFQSFFCSFFLSLSLSLSICLSVAESKGCVQCSAEEIMEREVYCLFFLVMLVKAMCS